MEDFKEHIENHIYSKYKVRPEYPWAQYPSYSTFKDPFSGKWFAIIMCVEKKKLGLYGDDPVYIINVKADTELIMILSGTDGFLPAYHMNKLHWLTMLLDGSVSKDQLEQLIDNSFRMVSDTPSRRIYEAVKKIPKGHVATYSQVAAMAGNPKMSRAVGNALHKNPDPGSIPCFRVVNSKGCLSGEFAFGGAGEQARLLAEDGIEVIDGRVDLKKYGITLNLEENNALR